MAVRSAAARRAADRERGLRAPQPGPRPPGAPPGPGVGRQADAVRANGDTFHFTNAAPQSAKFNQGRVCQFSG
ncbi:DNA/RNA non-specific endonuclease [Streptomyces sp. ML-6]|uniref:DNA/RNA non-specific endonuclease n=1 Tax=Streptomyces sp. ML-6 TaxID=2982693 RepID=UPI0032DEAD1A